MNSFSNVLETLPHKKVKGQRRAIICRPVELMQTFADKNVRAFSLSWPPWWLAGNRENPKIDTDIMTLQSFLMLLACLYGGQKVLLILQVHEFTCCPAVITVFCSIPNWLPRHSQECLQTIRRDFPVLSTKSRICSLFHVWYRNVAKMEKKMLLELILISSGTSAFTLE